MSLPRTSALLSVAFAGALFLFGCSRSSSSGPDAGDLRAATTPTRTGSCDRAAQSGTCSEYSGTYLAQNEGLLTTSCGKLGGTFVYAECPNTSNVGSCTLSTGEIRKFYGTGAAAFDPERAQSECQKSFRGAWKAQQSPVGDREAQ